MGKIDKAAMFEDYKLGMSHREIAEKYGCSKQYVGKVAAKEKWTMAIARPVVNVKPLEKPLSNDPVVRAAMKDEEISNVVKAGVVASRLNDLIDEIIAGVSKLDMETKIAGVRVVGSLAAAIRTNQMTIMQAYGVMTPAEHARIELLQKEAAREEEKETAAARPVEVTFHILGEDGELPGDPTV